VYNSYFIKAAIFTDVCDSRTREIRNIIKKTISHFSVPDSSKSGIKENCKDSIPSPKYIKLISKFKYYFVFIEEKKNRTELLRIPKQHPPRVKQGKS